MEDKDIPNIFNGQSKILCFSADSDIATATPLCGVVADSLTIINEEDNSVQHSGYYDCPEMRETKPLSFSVELNHPAELLLLKHPDVQKCLDRAKKMLDEIKSEIKAFYTTDPPRNRKERRVRARI